MARNIFKRVDATNRANGQAEQLLFGIVMSMITAFWGACSSKEPVAAQATPKKVSTETPQARVAAEPPKPATLKPQSRPEAVSKEKVATYRTLLYDGRKRVQAGDYDTGMALYEQALALRPGDPRVLVELGYAAFLKGDLDRAAQATQQGLSGIRDAKTEGSALYNLGRIAEKRGDQAEATRRYRESLAVRKNAVVEKRLASLGSDAEVTNSEAKTVEPTEIGRLQGPMPSIRAVCDTLIRENTENDNGEVGCEQTAAQGIEIGEGPLKRAMLLPIWRSYIGGGFETAAEVMRYLVMETENGFYRTGASVSYVYNPGAFGIWEELESELSLGDLVPGSPQEIVMKAQHRRGDTDLGILEEASEESEWLLVCGVVDGAPRCLAKIPTSYSYERTVMQMADGDSSEPVEHTPGLPIRSSYSFKVEFDGKGGYALTERKPPVGDVAVRAGAHAGAFSLLRSLRPISP